jgi:HK97 family phage prohead protease
MHQIIQTKQKIYKTATVQIKNQAIKTANFSTDNNGTIEGYFSIFATPTDSGKYIGQPDAYGDIVHPSAFNATLERRKKTGKPFPLCYNHDFDQIIGKVTEIKPDSYGAFFRGNFFGTDRAQEIRAICQTGVLYQFSWAYSTIDCETVTLTDGSRANLLKEVELYEVSIVAVPAESRAQMTDIKDADKLEKRNNLLHMIYDLESDQRAAQKQKELLKTIRQAEDEIILSKL